MAERHFQPTHWLLAFGLVALGLCGLSVADMFVPRPYDGVVPRSGVEGAVVVDEIIEGSAADRAGLRHGDRIIGIGRQMLHDADHAARILNRYRIGEEVLYLVQSPEGRNEIALKLGRRRIGGGAYLYTCLIGFSFFFVGLFVLVRQPTLRVSKVFFLLSTLFMVFLVCRLRPASYSGVDSLLLSLGTLAFLMLPPAFLHFYLLFPRPAWLQAAEGRPAWSLLARLWRLGWPLLYALPLAVFAANRLIIRMREQGPPADAGPPTASWWLLAFYLILGLAALLANSRQLQNPRERRGMALVVFGSFFGLLPFLVSSLVLDRHSQTFFLVGIMPLLMVPLTFTYAIVRFQLLDIRVILRRSPLYAVATLLVTILYILAIAAFIAFFLGTDLAGSDYFPFFLALAIVLLFAPLHRRVQQIIGRSLFAGRSRLEKAMVELGEAMTDQLDLQEVVEELVAKLPRILGLRFAALYLLRGYRLERVAGPEYLPPHLPLLPELQRLLQRRARLTRLDQLGTLPLRSQAVAELVEELSREGVEVLGDLASRRRHIGMVLLSGKVGQIALEREELRLLQQLLQQAALALETSLLLDERTQRAELEREMEIAATIQAQLLPSELRFATGWSIAAACRPARIVGGDFYTLLPAPYGEGEAVLFGDVCGKSVSGALMMMAAHEALHALALTTTDPTTLFSLTNRRLYALGQRNFVAMGYFAASPQGGGLSYLIAGQPAPLVRRRDGTVEELPLPAHRIPVGALQFDNYCLLEIDLEVDEPVLGYSDGLLDTRAPGGESFGEERLRQAVAAAPADPELLVEQVLEAIDTFSEGGLQYDDMTLVAVMRRPQSDVIMSDEINTDQP